MHDFMTYISCLEIINSLSCAVLPKVDKFSYTVVNISTYLIRLSLSKNWEADKLIVVNTVFKILIFNSNLNLTKP